MLDTNIQKKCRKLYNDALQGKRLLQSEECVLAQSCHYSYLYAKYVLHRRFLQAEPYLAKDAHWAYKYAFDIIKGRFPAAESELLKSCFYIYSYAIEIMNKRWRKAEVFLAQDQTLYASYVRHFSIYEIGGIFVCVI